jgi:hypothetical protein
MAAKQQKKKPARGGLKSIQRTGGGDSSTIPMELLHRNNYFGFIVELS